MRRRERVWIVFLKNLSAVGVLGAERDEALAGQPTLQAAGELGVDGPFRS
jgi:hypothetical protein